jgi:hypothetical protein
VATEDLVALSRAIAQVADKSSPTLEREIERQGELERLAELAVLKLDAKAALTVVELDPGVQDKAAIVAEVTAILGAVP